MKKIPLLVAFLICFCVSSNAQKHSPVTVAVIVDAENLFDESFVKESVESALPANRVRVDYFPAKLQITITIKSVKFQDKLVGYAVSYVFTEGIFYKRKPELVYLHSGVITTPELSHIADIIYKGFEPILDQKRL